MKAVITVIGRDTVGVVAKVSAEAAEVRDRFAALGKEMKMQVTVTRQEVFDAMHTI